MAIKMNQIVRVIIIAILSVGLMTGLYLIVNNYHFQKGITIKVHFEHIGTLSTGAWARRAGVKIGSVTSIELDQKTQRTVEVTIVFYPGQMIRADTKFMIMSGSLIGDQYIEVIPGTDNSEFVEEGHVFPGAPLKSIESLMLSGDTIFKDAGKSLTILAAILERNELVIEKTLKNIEDTSEAMRIVMLAAQEISVNLPRSLNKFMKLLEDLSGEESALSLLKRKETTAELKATLTNLNKLAESLAKVSADLEKVMKEILPEDKNKPNTP